MPDQLAGEGDVAPGMTFLDRPDAWRALMRERHPNIDAALQAACHSPTIGALGEQCATRDVGNEDSRVAFGLAVNQILNDWIELVILCSAGMGRSATRASRTLFETGLLLGNLRSDPETAGRYLSHGAVLSYQMAEYDVGERHLKGSVLKAARHNRNKRRRDLARVVSDLCDRFGENFRRQWSPMTVHTRAERANRLDEYSGYRFASAVLHGSSTGAAGTSLVYDTEHGDHPVYRIGPDLFLCSHAIRFGTVTMRRILTELAELGYAAAIPLGDQVAVLESCIDEIEQAYREAHAGISPPQPPPPLLPTVRIRPTGAAELWLQDMSQDRVVRATADDPNEWAQLVSRVVEQLGSEPGIVHVDIAASPQAGANWEPTAPLRAAAASAGRRRLRAGDTVHIGDQEFQLDEHGMPVRVD